MAPRVAVCPENELAPGERKTLLTETGMVSVYNLDGKLHAIDDLCPHMQENLSGGTIKDCIITCPLHGWRFDLRTGKSADYDDIHVDTYPVTIEDGIIYVETAAGQGDSEWDDWEGKHDPDDIEDTMFD